MEAKSSARQLDAILAEKGIEKYAYTLTQSEKQELNLENSRFKLMRTVYGGSASLRVFLGGRMGEVSGSDLSEKGLRKLADDACAAAESATDDPCHDIAPDQGTDVFRQGITEPDMDRFIDRIREFTDTVARDYPLVRIMSGIGAFDGWHKHYRSSNGTVFETVGGVYSFGAEISASDGERTTGFDFAGFTAKTLDQPFIEMGSMRRHVEDIQQSLRPEALTGKFEGTVILTPECAEEFIWMLLYNYSSDSVVIDGTSLWLNKVGQQVADEKLTVSLRPYDERIVTGERVTKNGFRSENVTLIENGILKAHRLSLYGANKTGRPLVKNTGSDLVAEPGTQPLGELIASVKKGLIMGGFSGGAPGTNGEFSGVAKNSFLIEDGRVKCAVTETMVNGNLGEAFMKIRGISSEALLSGSSAVPYIAVDGIVVSGK